MLEFKAPSGQTVDIQVTDLEYQDDGAKVLTFNLHVQVSPADYELIDQQEMFHLQQDVRGPFPAGKFEKGNPVELKIRLTEEQLEKHSDGLMAEENLAAYVVDNELNNTAYWKAMVIAQVVPLPPDMAHLGQMKEGYVTKWNKK